jgi:hypothetical protein
MASPKKQNGSTLEFQANEQSNIDKDILKGLNEKDVEIEHLKTTVVALSEKSAVRYLDSSLTFLVG